MPFDLIDKSQALSVKLQSREMGRSTKPFLVQKKIQFLCFVGTANSELERDTNFMKLFTLFWLPIRKIFAISRIAPVQKSKLLKLLLRSKLEQRGRYQSKCCDYVQSLQNPLTN
jgi:hypothetical protein